MFGLLEPNVPAFVYRTFYPRGWTERQRADIAQFLDVEGERAKVAVDGDVIIGWIGIRLHLQDRMGEIYILAVDPDRQRQGIANFLMKAAHAAMRSAGMVIVMVETGNDPGHAPSRAAYEAQGFERWPVARYFKPI